MNTTTTAAGSGQQIFSWVILIVMFAALYFFMIRPQNKREKEAKQMRNNLKPGDNIITIGGICGTVARVKEDSDRVVIMVGSERTKLEILKSAINSVDNSSDKAPTKSNKAEAEETAPNKPNKKNIKKLGSASEEASQEAPAEKAE